MKQGEAGVFVMRFFGWLLMGAGGLICLTSGACSLFFFLTILGEAAYFGSNLMLILTFGGIPFAVGLAVFLLGHLLVRKGEARQRPPRRVPSEDDGSGL